MSRACTSRFLHFFLSFLRKAGLLRKSRNIKTVSFRVYFPLFSLLALVWTDSFAQKTRFWEFAGNGKENRDNGRNTGGECRYIESSVSVCGCPMSQPNMDHQEKVPEGLNTSPSGRPKGSGTSRGTRTRYLFSDIFAKTRPVSTADVPPSGL